MDDYRDVDDDYRRSLEEIILKAGLWLPPIWPRGFTKEARKLHDRRVANQRAYQEAMQRGA
jgi:hypothetical protein